MVWQVWVDRGGTFTDVIAVSDNGEICVDKILSQNPGKYEDAVCAGIEAIQIKLGYNEPAAVIKIGTTVATNALLERKGKACAVIVTQGFKDSLAIGYQNRPDLFAIDVKKPESLYQQVVEVNQRMAADGSVLMPVDESQVKKQLQSIKQNGIESIAINLLHSVVNPEHELLIAALARELGFSAVYCSHQVSSQRKVIRRGYTTVAQAYLTPVIKQYSATINAHFKRSECLFMQSNGRLTRAEEFNGINSLLSGPAGGVVGAIQTAKNAGFERVIGFDMGGTSTDVCHYAGELERNYTNEIAGVIIDEAMMNIHTIAAGGGSILSLHDQRFQVGPHSAGANPGPACYGNGGPLTVTDANVLLGRIPLDSFPQSFNQLNHKVVVDLFKQMHKSLSHSLTIEQMAQGFIDIAVGNMSNAIKKISVDKGMNLGCYILNSFGGAGAQHACLIAEKLGINKILVPRLASALSAYGIGVADRGQIKQVSIEQDLAKLDTDEINWQVKQCKACINNLQANVSLTLRLHYLGSDTALAISIDTLDATQIAKQFHQLHRQYYGFEQINSPIKIQTLVLEAVSESSAQISHASAEPQKFPPQRLYSQGGWVEVQRIDLMALTPGETIEGPLLINADNTTVVIEANWQAQVLSDYSLLLSYIGNMDKKYSASNEVSPILLETFNKAFMHCAELMGHVLAKTAHSVNIKERCDYSCALFDAQGNLIANAPHMPVHLGSMSVSVKQILVDHRVKPGQSYLLNNPYRGGTHLPDVTVITPIFHGDKLAFFVGSRGHHADIGGITPGSLPAHSQSIEQEGVVIDSFIVVDNYQFKQQALMQLLINGRARNPEQNIADIQAQLAANHRGIMEVSQLILQYGYNTVRAYVKHIQQNAALAVRHALTRLHSGDFHYAMDDGKVIAVKITIDKDKAEFDFSGTSKQSSDNFNAPVAVVKAAILYVLRTLVDYDIPLNEGCLEPITIKLPAASLINPEYPHAVVAGNVETSQAIVNCLYCALGIVAASQGTMNNLTFGNDFYQYYETLCGGTGAGNGFNGCDAIHSHMTNSLLTDPEVLESRFPVQLVEFSIRCGSGGNGKFHGGSGAVRKIKCLQAMQINMISNHRQTTPPGLKGGEPGLAGSNYLLRVSGHREQLSACFEVDAQPGDTLVIETPGGGGYG